MSSARPNLLVEVHFPLSNSIQVIHRLLNLDLDQNPTLRMTKMSVSMIVWQSYSFSLLNTVLATVDEQLQVAGAEAFNKFQKYVLPRALGILLNFLQED